MTVLRLPRDTLHRVCSYLEPLLLVRLLSVSSTFQSKICSAPIDLSPDCFGDRYLTCSELLGAKCTLLHFRLVGLGLCDDFDLDLIDGSEEDDDSWAPDVRWQLMEPQYSQVLKRHRKSLRTLDLSEFPGDSLDVCLPCTQLQTLGSSSCP